nr:hypothetical protein BaRGS_022780 [Batillaria attramentaria]
MFSREGPHLQPNKAGGTQLAGEPRGHQNMSEDTVNNIIRMTRNDPVFDSLFEIFDADKEEYIEREFGRSHRVASQGLQNSLLKKTMVCQLVHHILGNQPTVLKKSFGKGKSPMKTASRGCTHALSCSLQYRQHNSILTTCHISSTLSCPNVVSCVYSAITIRPDEADIVKYTAAIRNYDFDGRSTSSTGSFCEHFYFFGAFVLHCQFTSHGDGG